MLLTFCCALTYQCTVRLCTGTDLCGTPGSLSRHYYQGSLPGHHTPSSGGCSPCCQQLHTQSSRPHTLETPHKSGGRQAGTSQRDTGTEDPHFLPAHTGASSHRHSHKGGSLAPATNNFLLWYTLPIKHECREDIPITNCFIAMSKIFIITVTVV